jgi:hypothetical protein
VLVGLDAGPVTHTVALVLAQSSVPPDRGEEFGKASPVGLVVVVLLGLATVLLVRSMTKRLRRLPASFDRPTDTPAGGTGPAEDPAGVAPSSSDPAPERRPGAPPEG